MCKWISYKNVWFSSHSIQKISNMESRGKKVSSEKETPKFSSLFCCPSLDASRGNLNALITLSLSPVLLPQTAPSQPRSQEKHTKASMMLRTVWLHLPEDWWKFFCFPPKEDRHFILAQIQIKKKEKKKKAKKEDQTPSSPQLWCTQYKCHFSRYSSCLQRENKSETQPQIHMFFWTRMSEPHSTFCKSASVQLLVFLSH